MRICDFDGDWTIDLDAITMVSPSAPNKDGKVVYKIFIGSEPVMSIDPEQYPRSDFVDMWKNYQSIIPKF